MDSKTMMGMNQFFGNDFSDVRIHTNTDAAQMNQDVSAHAFTVGNDIFFNKGTYQPKTKEGLELLAHELTHVVQQKGIPKSSKTTQNDLKKDNFKMNEEIQLFQNNTSQNEILQMQQELYNLSTETNQSPVQLTDNSDKIRRCASSEEGEFKKGEELGINTQNTQGWVRGFVSTTIRSLPDFLKVEYVERKHDEGGIARDYFKILEGPYAGKTGNLKTGYLEKKTWGSAVNIVFDSATNTVDYGAGKASAIITTNPGVDKIIKNKTYNLMLPDHPHSSYYGSYSGVWFRIEGGPQGDEYFHRGNGSLGCISVNENKWETIYNHVINKRSGNKYVGTAKRI